MLIAWFVHHAQGLVNAPQAVAARWKHRVGCQIRYQVHVRVPFANLIPPDFTDATDATVSSRRSFLKVNCFRTLTFVQRY